MPKIREIEYLGLTWRLSDLARDHGILPQTLASRLARDMPVGLALQTPIRSRRAAGRRGYRASCWRDD
jgi:hypothetical protein